MFLSPLSQILARLFSARKSGRSGKNPESLSWAELCPVRLADGAEKCRQTQTARASWTLLASVVIWLALALAGHAFLLTYANRPGAQRALRAAWPSEAGLPLSDELPTLLIFLHPHCPCSRASLEELALLLTHRRGRVQTEIVFLSPELSSENTAEVWTKTDLWRTASALPGVKVLLDQKGRAATAFGVETSGEALLFSREGRLLFQGGMTASRGHVGANAGRSALEALLAGEIVSASSTPVYGCSLF